MDSASVLIKQWLSAFSRDLPATCCFTLMKYSTANILEKRLGVASEVPKQIFTVKESTKREGALIV